MRREEVTFTPSSWRHGLSCFAEANQDVTNHSSPRYRGCWVLCCYVMPRVSSFLCPMYWCTTAILTQPCKHAREEKIPSNNGDDHVTVGLKNKWWYRCLNISMITLNITTLILVERVACTFSHVLRHVRADCAVLAHISTEHLYYL